MKTFLRLIIITSLIASCNQNATQEHSVTQKHNIKEVNIDSIKKGEEEEKTFDLKFSCSENSTVNLNSQIICKTTDLEKLKNNYQLTYKEKKHLKTQHST